MIGLWAGILVGCTGADPIETEALPTALDQPAFRFCHVPGGNAMEAQEWCDLLDDPPPERCAGLRATCEDGVVAEDPVFASGCNEQAGADGPADRLADAPEPPPEAPKGCERDMNTEGLQQLVRWIAALGVALLILLLVRVLWSTFGTTPRMRPAAVAPMVEPVEDDVLPDVPDLPSGDLLDAARAALAQGRLGEAVLLARGATLRHLAATDRIRLHRSRTDREYVRAVRRSPEIATELRTVVASVEHHRWGGVALTLEGARGALAAAERLIRLGAMLLLMVGLGGSVAQAQTPDRYRPSGDAALLEVLEMNGYDAGWRLRSLLDVDDEVHALFLDLSAISPTDEQWDHLRLWVEEGGVMVIGGDATFGFPEFGEHQTLINPMDTEVSGPLVDIGVAAPRWPGGVLRVYEDGEAWVSAVDPAGVPHGAAVSVLDIGQGVVVGIADPRLLWNGSFVHVDNEIFVGDLIYLGQGIRGWPVPTPARVQLATSAAVASQGGGGAENPLNSMSNARLLLFVVQLIMTWVLLGLWQGWPFASFKDPPAEGRLDFVEHVQALGTRWFRLTASRHALVRVATLWLGRLGPAGLQLAAQRHGMHPTQAKTWVTSLEALVAEPEGPNSPEDLERMEELWKVTCKSG